MRILASSLALPMLLLGGSSVAESAAKHGAKAMAANSCEPSRADKAWLDRAMAGWDYATRKITGIGHVSNVQALFFSRCVLTSSTAMNGGPRRWTAAAHDGQITLPTGDKIPAGVISFAMPDKETNFFVMSLPSVWRAANVKDNGLGSLELLMVAVVVHEGTHLAQMPTYGKRMEALSTANKLPESFDDDSIQKQFRNNADFSGSVRREIDLLLAVSKAPNRGEAVRLAREAQGLIKTRTARWFTGEYAYLADAEDIWLSLEGSAQWAAYQWVVSPAGGKISPAIALQSFGTVGTGWWSQDEGFALFMALERLTGNAWKRHAFHDGEKTVLQMLDESLAEK